MGGGKHKDLGGGRESERGNRDWRGATLTQTRRERERFGWVADTQSEREKGTESSGGGQQGP